ncbi:RING-H2 finger protein ATL54, partial [Cucurbita argyrosperma subsp. sororia]
MAVGITRKLFPVAAGTHQQSFNCSACPYDCPFDCLDLPDFYFSPPPPPPLPPFGDHQKQLPTIVIVILALFVGFFFTFSFYIIIVKCQAWRSGSGNQGAEASQLNGEDGEFLNENQVDHPIWFITTVGLQQSIINSITVCKYKKGEGLIEGTVCSVCLNEFQEDEMLRLLPKCSHAFHIGCVDTWLRTHTTCPLCRAHILTDFPTSNAARPPNSGHLNQNEANLGVIQETQMENLEGEEQSAVSGGGGVENRGDAVDEQRDIGVPQIGEIAPKEGVFESDDSKMEVTETTMNCSSAT